MARWSLVHAPRGVQEHSAVSAVASAIPCPSGPPSLTRTTTDRADPLGPRLDGVAWQVAAVTQSSPAAKRCRPDSEPVLATVRGDVSEGFAHLLHQVR